MSTGKIGNMLKKEIMRDSTITSNLTQLYQSRIPDDASDPAAKWQRISGTRDETLEGASGYSTARIQIDVYADRHNEAQTIAEDIRKKFNQWTNRQMGWNPGVLVHRVRVDGPRDEQTDINTDQRRRRLDLIIDYREDL